MKRVWTAAMGVAVVLAIAAGCGGDVSTMISTNPRVRDEVIGVFAGNGRLAAQMVDGLLGIDTTRAIVVDRVFTNGGARQSVLLEVAKDRAMVDGVLNLAIQDTAMKTHVLTLLKGMEMGGAVAPTP